MPASEHWRCPRKVGEQVLCAICKARSFKLKRTKQTIRDGVHPRFSVLSQPGPHQGRRGDDRLFPRPLPSRRDLQSRRGSDRQELQQLATEHWTTINSGHDGAEWPDRKDFPFLSTSQTFVDGRGWDDVLSWNSGWAADCDSMFQDLR
jgi:hypothetical protein